MMASDAHQFASLALRQPRKSSATYEFEEGEQRYRLPKGFLVGMVCLSLGIIAFFGHQATKAMHDKNDYNQVVKERDELKRNVERVKAIQSEMIITTDDLRKKNDRAIASINAEAAKAINELQVKLNHEIMLSKSRAEALRLAESKYESDKKQYSKVEMKLLSQNKHYTKQVSSLKNRIKILEDQLREALEPSTDFSLSPLTADYPFHLQRYNRSDSGQ